MMMRATTSCIVLLFLCYHVTTADERCDGDAAQVRQLAREIGRVFDDKVAADLVNMERDRQDAAAAFRALFAAIASGADVRQKFRRVERVFERVEVNLATSGDSARRIGELSARFESAAQRCGDVEEVEALRAAHVRAPTLVVDDLQRGVRVFVRLRESVVALEAAIAGDDQVAAGDIARQLREFVDVADQAGHVISDYRKSYEERVSAQ